MPLVSEQVGLKEANTTSVFLRQLAILIAQMIKDAPKKGYVDEHMKGAKAILKHINKGGQVNYQAVDVEDAALLEKLMQNKRIPYTKVSEIDGKAVYVTRDTDKKKMEHVFEMMADELKVGFKEMKPLEFLTDNEGREVGHALGYTEAELEVFRKEAAKLGFSYAVVGNEKVKGQYDILYSKRDDALVKKALKGMAYEMSGPEGREYMEDIQRALAVKNSVMSHSKENPDKVLFIVNNNNPMQFITIQGNTMVQHTLSVEEKTGRDGQPKLVVKDSIKKTIPFGNRELTLAMKAYGKCSIIPENRMSFVKGFDSSKAAIVPDAKEAVRAMETIQKDCKRSAFPFYEANIGRKGSVQFDKVRTLSDVEPDVLADISRELASKGLYYMAVSGDFLFKEKDKAAVDIVLDKHLYKEESFLERFQSMLYYEGRGPEGIDLRKPDAPYYVLSAKDPNIVLKVSKDEFEIIKDGSTVAKMDALQEGFEEQLSSLLSKMEDVAVLTEDEMKREPAEKVALIERRALSKENEASKQYYRDYDEKKEQFVNTKIEDMSPEDKEIVKSYTCHEIRETYVERSFSEKIMDMDFGTKLREEHVQETRTTRSSEPDR